MRGQCVQDYKNRIEAGYSPVYVEPRRKIARDPELASTTLKGLEPCGTINSAEARDQALLKVDPRPCVPNGRKRDCSLRHVGVYLTNPASAAGDKPRSSESYVPLKGTRPSAASVG
jgi:hypothetical protein